MLVNAIDRTNDVSNKGSLSIASKASTLIAVPLSPALKPGNLVTVVLEFQESDPPLGTGLRVGKTHFPIEAYPKSHECPFPTVKDDNYKVCKSNCLCITHASSFIGIMVLIHCSLDKDQPNLAVAISLDLI